MRVAVLSDIHGNHQALEAVAKDLDGQDVQEIWCLGDVVGYGGNPRECLQWVHARATHMVKGNHDEAVSTGGMTAFNASAAEAARSHAHHLTPPERSILFAWPEQISLDVLGQRVLLVHASPDDPLREYVTGGQVDVKMTRWAGRADIILMGHTHHPLYAAPDGSPWRAEGFPKPVAVAGAPFAPILLNPGSVGQPRDQDPRASYVVLDFAAREARLRRVAYDVDAAAQSIRRLGLPHILALRLFEGK